MYVVAIFALALLSPLPFVSPFVYDVQNVEAQSSNFDIITNNADQQSQSTAPQELNTFTLTSSTDNTNPSYAKAGDTITVTFTTDDILHYCHITINISSDTDLLSRSLDTFISKLMYPSGSVSNTVIDAVRTLLKIDTDAFLSFIVAVAL